MPWFKQPLLKFNFFTMRDKIWYEMTHVKFGETYLAIYLNRQKSTRKLFKVFTLVFSTSGVLGWKVWAGFPIIACILISIIQLLNLVENQIIINDSDIDKVSELRNKYITYFNDLEKLWVDYEAKRLNENEANDYFYKLRQIASTIEALDNKLHIQRIQSMCTLADKETRNYFNQYHS